MDEKKTEYIYVLRERKSDRYVIQNGAVRYVGHTVNPKGREVAHWQGRKEEDTDVAKWLHTLRWPPVFQIVETVADDARSANDREGFWIHKYTEEGHKLLNMTNSPTYPEWHRCKRCKKRLSADEFEESIACIDGVRPWCNPCVEQFRDAEPEQYTRDYSRLQMQARAAGKQPRTRKRPKTRAIVQRFDDLMKPTRRRRTFRIEYATRAGKIKITCSAAAVDDATDKILYECFKLMDFEVDFFTRPSSDSKYIKRAKIVAEILRHQWEDGLVELRRWYRVTMVKADWRVPKKKPD